MMATAKRIILCLWLILACVAHASAAVFGAPENRIWEFSKVGYDAIDHAGVDYDGLEKPSSAYEVVPSRAQSDIERPTEAQRTSFALFGRLLAANNPVGIPLKNNSARKLLICRGANKQQARETIASFDGQIYATQGRAGEAFTITETSLAAC
jgi:hypothetical protein